MIIHTPRISVWGFVSGHYLTLPDLQTFISLMGLKLLLIFLFCIPWFHNEFKHLYLWAIQVSLTVNCLFFFLTLSHFSVTLFLFISLQFLIYFVWKLFFNYVHCRCLLSVYGLTVKLINISTLLLNTLEPLNSNQ